VRAEPLVLAHGRYERVGENRNVLVSKIESLGPLARRVAEARALAQHPLNPKLFLEDLLIQYRKLAGGHNG